MLNKIRIIVLWGVVALGGFLGCGPAAPVGGPPDIAAVEPTPLPHTPDQALLKEGLQGREMSPGEVATLSDRLLGDGNSALQDEKTMARLELLLLKGLKTGDKASRPILTRNLGIINYHQKKYKLARQYLQQSNELYPKSARTHFYLARLFAHQGLIDESKGKKKDSKHKFKQAAIEMGLARKLEPQNSLYRQDIRQIVQSEPGK